MDKKEKVSVVEPIQQRQTEVKPKGKKNYRVVLTCAKYTIVADEKGNNIQLDGNYNIKIGGYLEV